MWSAHHDVVTIDAGVASSAFAHALTVSPSASSRHEQLRVALLERSFAEPDRIVGGLLQPGGVLATKELGMEGCLEGIDAILVKGYCVAKEGETVGTPYMENY